MIVALGPETSTGALPDKKYFKIGETSAILGVKPHVLRYWETEFHQIRPCKSKTGQRLYRRRDVEAFLKIQELLYEKKFTVAGARQALRAAFQNEPEEPVVHLVDDSEIDESLELAPPMAVAAPELPGADVLAIVEREIKKPDLKVFEALSTAKAALELLLLDLKA